MAAESVARVDLITVTFLTLCAPVQGRFADFAGVVASGEEEALSARLRRAETIGRPLGTADFIAVLEARAGRPLAPAKRGPKPKLNALSP